jgi:hypothetical protein
MGNIFGLEILVLVLLFSTCFYFMGSKFHYQLSFFKLLSSLLFVYFALRGEGATAVIYRVKCGRAFIIYERALMSYERPLVEIVGGH